MAKKISAPTTRAQALRIVRRSLERFVLLQNSPDARELDFLEWGKPPYAGHVKLFETSFYQAKKLAKAAGGLIEFGVYDYRGGRLNFHSKVKNGDHDSVEEIQDFLLDQSRASVGICALCGKRAKPNARFAPYEWAMPICGPHIHGQEAVRTLIGAPYSLDEIEDGLERRGLLQVAS